MNKKHPKGCGQPKTMHFLVRLHPSVIAQGSNASKILIKSTQNLNFWLGLK